MEIEDIKRLNVQPGDVLVLRYAGLLHPDGRERLSAMMKNIFGPLDVKTVILDQGMTIDVIAAATDMNQG
jgi:hypothetical protein